MLAEMWAKPGANVSVVGDSDLVEDLWAERPSLTIMPFHQLTPDLKVLQVDGSFAP